MPITVGCDPEFILLKNGQKVNSPFNQTIDAGGIGIDHGGSVGELRPKFGTPTEVTNNIREMFKWIKRQGPEYSIVAGGGKAHGCSIGGHIHIGGVNFNGYYSPTRYRNRGMRPLELQANTNPQHKLIYALDFFIGKRLKKVSGGQRNGSQYGRLSDVETKNHGFEYRTPPSWLSDPMITEATLATAKRIAEIWLEKPTAFDPFITAKKMSARKRDYNLLLTEGTIPTGQRNYWNTQITNFRKIVFSKTYRLDDPRCLDYWTNPVVHPVVDGRQARGSSRIQMQVCQIKVIDLSAAALGRNTFESESVAKVIQFGMPEIKIYCVNNYIPWQFRMNRSYLNPNTVYFSKGLRNYLKIKKGSGIKTRFIDINGGTAEQNYSNVVFVNTHGSEDFANKVVELISNSVRTKLKRSAA